MRRTGYLKLWCHCGVVNEILGTWSEGSEVEVMCPTCAEWTALNPEEAEVCVVCGWQGSLVSGCPMCGDKRGRDE